MGGNLRRLTRLAAFAAAFACAGGAGVHQARAITGGQLDGNGHPAVVLVASQQGSTFFRCSGTLIAPTYVLTAGHCVGEPGEFSAIRVFTESDVDHSTPHTAPFCTQGGLTDPGCVEGVAWAAHPQFTEAAFNLHDVGVIKLSRPVNLPADEYGQLPGAGLLDSLHPGPKTTFTSVGYGLQRVLPSPASFLDRAARVRMVAYPQLVQVNTGFTGPSSLLLSDNQDTGGICF